MGSINALGLALNVAAGEGRLTWLLFAHAFFRGMTKAFVRIATFTLFLSAFEISLLPLVYLGTAFVGTFVTLNYLKLEKRLGLGGLVSANLTVTALGLSGFALALLFTDAKWIAFVLPIVGEIIVGLINTELASVNARVFTVRQGKRLVGVVGSGEFLAQIGVGLFTVTLVSYIGSSNLLLLAALGAVAALLVVRRVFDLPASRLAQPASDLREEAVESNSRSWLSMAKNRYVLLLFATYSLFIMVYYLVDSAFYSEVSARFSSDEEIAVFLGQFSALYGALALISLAFLSGNVLQRYGLLVGMMILPAGMAAGVLAVILVAEFAAPAALIFWLVALTQLMRFVLSNAFSRPCRNILTYALPVRQRSWVLATVFGIVDPVATGIAGLFLWLLMSGLGFGSVQLFYVASVFLAAWIVLLIPTYRQYLVSLTGSLSRRQLGGATLNLNDRSTVSIIRHGLSSAYPAEVIYCLNLLEDLQYEALESTLCGMLGHPEARVRREAYRKLQKSQSAAVADRIRNHIADENDAAVLGEAVKTLACLGDTETVDEIAPFLDHADPRVRLGAMVGLLKYGGIEGVLTAGSDFLDKTRSEDAADREFAARVCGEIASKSFDAPLLKLLQDRDLAVCNAAIAASGHFGTDKSLPVVAACLARPRLRVAASAALIARGEDCLATLQSLFEDRAQTSDTLARIAYVLGRIGGDEAIAILLPRIGEPDLSLRLSILEALANSHYRARENEYPIVEKLLAQEVRDAAWISAAQVCIEGERQTCLLTRALELDLDRARARILLLLSFCYSRETILRCRLYLSDRSLEKRDHALEIIDNLVPVQTREMLFPVLEDLTPRERSERLAAGAAVAEFSEEEWLGQIVADPGNRFLPWTRSCALHEMGCSPRPAYAAIAAAALSSANPLVRETAIWALAKINPGQSRDRCAALLHDAVPQVSAMARSILKTAC